MADEREEAKGFRVTDRRGQEKEEPKPQAKPEFQPEPRPDPQKAAPSPPKPPRGALPPIDFPNFILSLSTSALIHMGLVAEPGGAPPQKNLPAARQEIGILEMLAEKTKGNLNPDEAKLMEEVLYELRLRYVQASK
jgi:hypothetical protein